MHQLILPLDAFFPRSSETWPCAALRAQRGGARCGALPPGVWGFSLAVWGVRFGGNLRKFWAAGLRDVRRLRHADVCFGTAKLPSL